MVNRAWREKNEAGVLMAEFMTIIAAATLAARRLGALRGQAAMSTDIGAVQPAAAPMTTVWQRSIRNPFPVGDPA